MNTQIYEEATHWLVKHRDGDLDSREKQAFDAWLRESPQHVRAYLEMSALWETVPALDPSWNPTAEQLIARARGEGNIHPLPAIPPPARRAETGLTMRRSLGLAATFLVAIAGVTTWYRLGHATYSTGIGEQRSLVLEDGSTVELNAHSKIEIHFTAAQRDVDLIEGQALFQVAHNAARPFIVHSGATDVRVVGTRFDVYKKRSGTVVTVVEGEVSVPASNVAPTSDGNNAILITAGEQLMVPAVVPSRARNLSAGGGNPQRANVEAATAWIHRTLVFESSPLTEVAEEFNRYNTRQLVIVDPALASFRISGMFSSVDPALLMKFLRTQPELDVTETDREIRISRR